MRLERIGGRSVREVLVAVAGPLLGFSLILAGTILLRDPGKRSLALVACLVGAALAVIGLRRHAVPDRGVLSGGSDARRLAPSRAAALAMLASAVMLALAANVFFLAGRSGLFGVTTWLWIGSVIAVVLAGALFSPATTGPGTTPRRGLSVLEGIVLLAVVAAAFATRLHDLQGIPFAIHPDEILTGRVAIGAFLEGNVSPFITVWPGINLPALWFAFVAGSLDLAGHTLAALRLPAALVGAAASVPLYAFLRESWGTVAAAVGTAVFATSASSVHYSRVTLNNHVATFFWIACFFFVARGWRTGRALPWVTAGVLGGLGEHTYYGTRLLPFILAVFFLYLLALERRIRRTLGSMLWLAAGYVIAFGPLLAHHVRTPGSYLGRGTGVLTVDGLPLGWQAALETGRKLLASTKDNLLGFGVLPDGSGVYWHPLLSPAEAALLLIGCLLLAWSWRYPPAFLLLLAGTGVIFVGGVLVPPVRSLAHWTPAFACFYAALAVPVAAWYGNLRALGEPWKRAGLAALVIGLAILSLANVTFYFRDYQVTRPEFEIRAAHARWEAELGNGFVVRTLGNGWIERDPELAGYLTSHQDASRLVDVYSELPLAGVEGRGVAFAFLPREDRDAAEAYVSCLYPAGVEGEVKSHSASGAVHFFDSYVVPPPVGDEARARVDRCLTAAGSGKLRTGASE